MIFQNDDLPTEKTKTFFTRFDNAKTVLLSVYESTSMNLQEDLKNGRILGELNLEIKGNLPKGSPITVELCLGEDGTISVKGYELTGNTKIEATMKTEALLSAAEFKEQKKEIDPMLLLIE
jgi:molecular chaperone DnaK (HSP70)